jgi:tetratricopeptide (TPR) repeat protein
MLAALTSCNTKRVAYHKGMAHLQAQEYGPALDKFNSILAEDPEQKGATFGKARALYELGRYDEALPVFEQFLTMTEREKSVWKDQRFDAEFYRDKCKQELGMEVPQDPDAIPEERMRY